MEQNERDIFSRLEHEIGRDLSQWRRDIVASFEKCCLIAFEIEESKPPGSPLDINDPTVYQAIRNRVINLLAGVWIDDKNSPRPGDPIAVTGESYWLTLDSEAGEMTNFRLPIGYKIEGPLLHWDIKPYIDEAGLQERVHRNLELAYKHTHPFGLHLILDHPTICDEQGDILPIQPDQVYLPLHYARAQLKLYAQS